MYVNATGMAMHAGTHDEGPPERTMPPGWVLDKIADEKLSGRFDTSRANQCPACFQVRSANGTCGGCP